VCIDFQHNLGLLNNRDEAIARQQMLFEEVKSVIQHKDAGLSDAKIALDVAQAETARVRSQLSQQVTLLQQQNESLAEQQDSLHVEYRAQLEERAQQHEQSVAALALQLHTAEMGRSQDTAALLLKHDSEVQARAQELRLVRAELQRVEVARERAEGSHSALLAQLTQTKERLETRLAESQAQAAALEQTVSGLTAEKHDTALNMSSLEVEIGEFARVKSDLVSEYQRKFRELDQSRVELESRKEEEVAGLQEHFREVEQRLQTRAESKQQDLQARVERLTNRLSAQVQEGAAVKLQLQKELEHKESQLRETESKLRELPLEKDR
jgi:chromosome segregation ATPase